MQYSASIRLFPVFLSLFQKFFRFFQKIFRNVHLFADFITLYIWSTKNPTSFQVRIMASQIFLLSSVLYCAGLPFPPAIDSARCRSMIYFLSPARHTLLSHVASGENVGRKPLPSATQRDVTPVLSDDAALFLYTKKIASKTSDCNRSMRICLAMPRSGGAFS